MALSEMVVLKCFQTASCYMLVSSAFTSILPYHLADPGLQYDVEISLWLAVHMCVYILKWFTHFF